MSGRFESRRKQFHTQARFVSYFEKHRIYELFYEIATELAIKRPDDHLAFIQQYLRHAALKLGLPKVILLAPPQFDKIGLAQALQKELDFRLLTLKDLRGECSKDIACRCDETEELTLNMKKILESEPFQDCGWILVDVPRTKREARAFQRLGIFPSHVVEITLSSQDSITSGNEGFETCNSKSPEEVDYVKHLGELRETYSNFLIEVDVGMRSIDELAEDCAKLIKIKKHCGAPSLFRIVLLGPRGSGSTDFAKYVSERFNLVHVDFDYVFEQARLQETSLGEKLRLFEHRWGERPNPEIRIQIVDKVVSSFECLKRGWILTNYPKTVEDFKLLDTIPTPPNRIIFIEVDPDICRKRLLNRRYNIITGSEHNLCCKKDLAIDDAELGVHPKDYRMAVERDLQEYEENATDMMEYAGKSAVKIDGNNTEKGIQEKLEACLIRPAPFSNPRTPNSPPKMDPINIEIDPDDAPDACFFDDVCKPEPKFSFI